MEGFELILDADESIFKTYKPNKKRFTLFALIGGLPALFIPTVFIVLAILMLTGVISNVDSEGNKEVLGPIFFLGFGGFFFLVLLFGLLSPFFKYKKVMYCVTNKRIIVRHGLIGVDFKSLNLSAIGAINVEVNFLDKLIKPNTGRITFLSASAPIVNQNQKGQNVPFEFSCVDNPYEVYREVKGYIDMNASK